MKKFKEMLPGILVLIILFGLAGVLFYYIGRGFASIADWVISLVQQISALDTVLIIALISSAITVLGLIVNSIISIKLKTVEYKNKLKDEARSKMEIPYKRFVHFIYDVLLDEKRKTKMSSSDMMERMVEFSKDVTVYGSNKVIKKWATYRTSVNKLSSIDNLKQLEEILFAIRADLGMKKKGMKTGDILALFINDFDEAVKQSK